MSFVKGYKRLDYIESSGTQWINTGWHATNNTSFEINCKINSGSTDKYLFGTAPDWSAGNNYFMYLGSQNDFAYGYGTGYGNASFGSSIIGDGKYHNIHYIGNHIYFDGSNKASGSGGTYTCTYPLFLFTVSNGSGESPSSGLVNIVVRCCRVWDNGALVRDFVPAMRESDHAIGLLDLVNNVFYTNQGTGVFTYGQILTENITFTDNPLSLTIGEDTTLTANFSTVGKFRYKIAQPTA